MVAEFRSPKDHRVTDLQLNAQAQLEEEILDAGLKQSYDPAIGRLELAQIAKWTGAPIETIEQIAQEAVYRQVRVDLEESDFNGMIAQVRKIEAMSDAGLREWKLSKLARRYKLSRSEMVNAYNKALINQAPIVPLKMSQLKEAFSQSTKWLIQGWFPSSVAMLIHGFGGTAKTLFLYEVAAAIAKGKPWNGYPVSQGEVLILQADEPPQITQERLEILEITDDDPLHVFPGWQVESMPQLESYLVEHPVKFILIDSNTSANRNTLISENDVEYARPLLQLSDIAARHNCTIAVIHHSNGNGDARGTKALHNSVSEVWALSIANEDTGERLLRVQKNRIGRPPGRYKFGFDPEQNSFTYQGQEGNDDGDEATTEKRIELWLLENAHKGKLFEAEEIAHSLRMSVNTTRKRLYELWSKGLVQRSRIGKKFLYFAGTLRESSPTDPNPPTDPCPKTMDQLADQLVNSYPTRDTAPTDQLIRKNVDSSLMQNVKNTDQLISSPESLIEAANLTDPRSDPPQKTSDHFAVIENADQFVEAGDIVIPSGLSTWFSYGSDPIASEIMPTLYRESNSVPIVEFPIEFRKTLLQPSRVLKLMRAGRVRVRNQETGRNDTFLLKDLTVLSKSNGKTQ